MFSEDDNYYHGEYPRKRNGMATASMTFGIISLVTCSVFYIAIPCAAMSILCGLLSRTGKRMTKRGQRGLICGILGLIFSIGITTYAVYTVWHTPQMRSYVQQYMELYRDQLGLSPQELPFPWEDITQEPQDEIDPDILDRIFSDDEEAPKSSAPEENLVPEEKDYPSFDDGRNPLDDIFNYFYGAPSPTPQPSQEISGGEFV